MFSQRLPLIVAFTGGSLMTAGLVGVWETDAETSVVPSRVAVVDRIVEDEPTASAAEGVAPVAPPKASDDDGLPAAESGSSLADVLTRLEAAYRKELAAAERVTPVAEVTADSETPPEPAAAAPAPAEEPPPLAPPPAVAPVAVAPVNVHIENVQQDVHNGDVHNGNVHQGDVNQAQQIALVQYVQLFALPPNCNVARPTSTQAKARR